MTQLTARSEIKSMLTACSGSWLHSEISNKWLAKAWVAFKKIYRDEPRKNYWNYVNSIVLIFDAPRGGAIIFWRDNLQPDLFWIDGYSNGQLIKPEKIKAMLVICGLVGAKCVAVNVKRAPKMARYWDKIGLEFIGDYTYAIKVGPEWISRS